tara:strand:+ start:294 stop:575 length:282 start_codon:yes stop_codon:yes gene_type:complete
MTTTYKRKTTRKKKPMTEQVSTTNTITKVQSHLPDHYLIDRNALWDDFKTRMKINNVEVAKAMEDLKTVVNQTHKVMLPYVDKAVNKVKELRS